MKSFKTLLITSCTPTKQQISSYVFQKTNKDPDYLVLRVSRVISELIQDERKGEKMEEGRRKVSYGGGGRGEENQFFNYVNSST